VLIVIGDSAHLHMGNDGKEYHNCKCHACIHCDGIHDMYLPAYAHSIGYIRVRVHIVQQCTVLTHNVTRPVATEHSQGTRCSGDSQYQDGYSYVAGETVTMSWNGNLAATAGCRVDITQY